MEIAKALILAGSRGPEDRPYAVAPSRPRHLFPVANRPILFHHLEALRAAGVKEATILSDVASVESIAAAVGDGGDWRLSVRHAVYEPGTGLGAALTAGGDFFADGEPVLVQHGDALLEPLQAHLMAFAQEQLDALALRLPAAGDTARRAPAPAPAYVLSPRAIAILRDGGPTGENPVDGVRAGGGRVGVRPVDGCLACHGDVEALLESNRRILEGLRGGPAEQPVGVRVQGAVEIHPTAVVRRSVLRGPLVIGPDARISDAYIGPSTSIGAGVEIEAAEIEHSIVLPEASLRFVGTRIESSVIGRRARIGRSFEPPGALRLAVGEGAEVVLA
jgi:glucose-1-phosphate thymidylyltransferase